MSLLDLIAVSSAIIIVSVVAILVVRAVSIYTLNKELRTQLYDTSNFISRQHAQWEDMTEFGSMDLAKAVKLTDELEQKRMELEATLYILDVRG